ncbi:unnamed protein product [Musa acuminata subsp. burmannicoides]
MSSPPLAFDVASIVQRFHLLSSNLQVKGPISIEDNNVDGEDVMQEKKKKKKKVVRAFSPTQHRNSATSYQISDQLPLDPHPSTIKEHKAALPTLKSSYSW